MSWKMLKRTLLGSLVMSALLGCANIDNGRGSEPIGGWDAWCSLGYPDVDDEAFTVMSDEMQVRLLGLQAVWLGRCT